MDLAPSNGRLRQLDIPFSGKLPKDKAQLIVAAADEVIARQA
jgi:hypothetical protein